MLGLSRADVREVACRRRGFTGPTHVAQSAPIGDAMLDAAPPSHLRASYRHAGDLLTEAGSRRPWPRTGTCPVRPSRWYDVRSAAYGAGPGLHPSPRSVVRASGRPRARWLRVVGRGRWDDAIGDASTPEITGIRRWRRGGGGSGRGPDARRYGELRADSVTAGNALVVSHSPSSNWGREFTGYRLNRSGNGQWITVDIGATATG